MNDGLIFLAEIVCLLILVAGSAFFSGSETALFSLSRARLLSYKSCDSHLRRKIASLMEDYNRTLIVLILGNMFVNTGISMLDNELLSRFHFNEYLKLAVSILLTVFILLMFGEVTPKMIAILNSEKTSDLVVLPVWYIKRGLMPLILLIEKISSAILNIMGRKRQMPLSPGEYASYVQMADSLGAFSERETELIGDIFSIRNARVSRISRPRNFIECVRKDMSSEEIANEIRSSCQLFYPVAGKDIDDAEHFLSSKRFFMLEPEKRPRWFESDCVFRAVFLPENTSIIKAFSHLKKKKTPVALVCDEFGGISGILRVKDVYEEIVGEMEGEYETPDWEIRRFFAGVWHTGGNVLLSDIGEISGWEQPPDSPASINGIFLEKLGRVPEVGDVIEINHARFTAIAVSNNTVVEAEFRYPLEATSTPMLPEAEGGGA